MAKTADYVISHTIRNDDDKIVGFRRYQLDERNEATKTKNVSYNQVSEDILSGLVYFTGKIKDNKVTFGAEIEVILTTKGDNSVKNNIENLPELKPVKPQTSTESKISSIISKLVDNK